MPLYREFGTLVLHWDLRSLRKWWPILSEHIIGQFGEGPFTDHGIVRNLFLSGYERTLDEFRRLTNEQRGLSFYRTVAGLYENTVVVQGYVRAGNTLAHIKNQDFVTNRNGLRLILERACELEISGNASIADITHEQVEILEDLLYLATWIWSFAEGVAHQDVLGDIQEVHVDPDRTLRIVRKGEWDRTIENRRLDMIRLGKQAIQNVDAVGELIEAFRVHFGIDYFNNVELIPSYRGFHPYAEYPILVDAPFDAMVEIFAKRSKVPIQSVRQFYEGFSIRPDNTPGLDRIVRSPGGENRHMYRPALIWNVDGQLRMICGQNRWEEAHSLIAANGLQWRAVPSEWLENEGFKTFVRKKDKEHDKILEERFEAALKLSFQHYHADLSALQVNRNRHVRFDGVGLGQVDFLFLSHQEHKIYVVDCKYLRPQHGMIGFRGDQSDFEKDYAPRMKRKVEWFCNNIQYVERHFSFRYPSEDIQIQNYAVEGLFVLNTPTMYCYNGEIRTYSIVQFEEWAAIMRSTT